MVIAKRTIKKKKALIMWFGRANPTTHSHVIGFHTVLRLAKEMNCPYAIYLTNTRTKDTMAGTIPSSKLNNPQSGKTKIKYCKKAVPEAKFTLASKSSKTQTLYDAIGTNAKKFETIYIVAGPDRKSAIEDAKKYFAESCTIEHIEVHGRQIVDINSGEVVDVRATKLREAIYSLDFETAERFMPLSLPIQAKWAMFYDTLVEAGRLKGYDEYMTQKVITK